MRMTTWTTMRTTSDWVGGVWNAVSLYAAEYVLGYKLREYVLGYKLQ